MNKEFGSDFHYIYPEKNNERFFDHHRDLTLFFSGRVAIYNLLKFGIQKHRWQKVGFPSYYCHEVVEFCQDLDIEIVLYEYNPIVDNSVKWHDEVGTVIVNVAFFGIKKPNLSFLKQTVIIEDVTHDLLSLGKGSADYYFGSLRKQLPVGAGGFCTLKKGESFSDDLQVSLMAREAYQKKATAMFLKTEYLQDRLEKNDLYRRYYLEAENMFENHQTDSLLPEQAVSQLQTFSVDNLISKTQINIKLGVEWIIPTEKFQILNNNNGFCLILYCLTSQIRGDLRSYLIEKKIFPAILWPNQILDNDKDLQNRILCIHMDFRYSAEEIKHISQTINNFFEYV